MRRPDTVDQINDMTPKQIENRKLYWLGVLATTHQAIAESVDRIASALEAITSIDVEVTGDEPVADRDMPESADDRVSRKRAEVAGRMWDQKGPS